MYPWAARPPRVQRVCSTPLRRRSEALGAAQGLIPRVVNDIFAGVLGERSRDNNINPVCPLESRRRLASHRIAFAARCLFCLRLGSAQD